MITTEELLAYENGELSKEDADRVRALLESDPELLRALNTDFDDDDDGEEVSQFVVERQLRAFRREHPREDKKVAGNFWPSIAAVAAVLAIAFGALFWRAQSKVDQPRIGTWQAVYLEPVDGRRGPGEVPKTLSSNVDLFLLDIALLDERNFASYRIDIVAGGAKSPVWSSVTARPENDTFNIVVPRKALRAGAYEAVVYGVEGSGRQQVARYAFRVR